MAEIFGTSDENGNEVIIYRGQGRISSLNDHENGKATHVFIQDSDDGMPLEGWLRTEDPIMPAVRASHEERAEVSYRIEKVAKDPQESVMDIVLAEKTDQLKSFLSAINGESSPTSLTDIEEDDDAYEINSVDLGEIEKQRLASKPAPKETTMYELYNSEGGVNYSSSAFMGAVSFETFSRDRLLKYNIINIKDVFHPKGEAVVRKHMKELMRLSNRVQLMLFDNRPGAKVNTISSTHTRIRGMLFSTLDLGVNLDEEEYEPHFTLMDNQGEILDEVSQRLEDIVYSRMVRIGELAVDQDLMNPEKLFPKDEDNEGNN